MNVKTAYQADYTGGLNNTASPSEIERNEASRLYNWDITYQGKLTQRPGAVAVGNSMGINAITGGAAFIRNAGADLVATESTNLYYLNTATWTKIADNLTNTAGLTFWFTNIQTLGKIFLHNEDNVIKSWDRASTTLNTCLTELASSIPHGNVSRWHKNFMFMLNNVNVSGTKYANRIYWSDIGDPTTWDTTNDWFEIPGDGRAITMIDMGQKLVIFKERAIQYLDGWGDTSWRITASSSNVSNLDEQIGCIAPRGVCRLGNDAIFIDQEGNIRRLYLTDQDTLRRDIISTKILGTLSGINKTQLSKAVLWSNDNKIYVAMPNSTDTINSIIAVFDVIAARREAEAGRKAEAWTTYTGWTPSIFWDYPTSATPDLYFGNASSGDIYRVSKTALDDNGVAIDCNWEGKDDYFKEPFMYKRYRFGHGRASSQSGSATIGIWGAIDSGIFSNLENMSLVSTGSTLGPTGTARMGPTGTFQLGGASTLDEYYRFDQGGGTTVGRSIKMSIRHNEVNSSATFGTFSTHYQPMSIR